MKIIYECEKVVILQEKELFVIHILDNYRFVKEIIANRNNLLSILQKEFDNTKLKKGFIFGKKIKQPINEIFDVEKIINFI